MRHPAHLTTAALALLLAGGLPAMGALPASAAPQVIIRNTVQEVSCAFQTEDSEGLFLTASSDSASGSSGAGAFVEDNGGVKVLEGYDAPVTFGPQFATDIPVVDPATGEPAGTVIVRATTTPAGPPTVEQVDERYGNLRTTGTITTTEFETVVTRVEVPRYPVVPGTGSCTAVQTVFDLRQNDPRYFVLRETRFGSATCAVTGIPGSLVFFDGDRATQPQVRLAITTDQSLLSAAGSPVLRNGRGSFRAPLVDRDTDQVVAQLTAGVEVARAGRASLEEEREGDTVTLTRTIPYRTAVVVSISDGRRGRATCPAAEVRTLTITRRR